MSGRGVCDEYQISDFDFQPNSNHTLNLTNSNPISFNDSGNWNRTGNQDNSYTHQHYQEATQNIQSISSFVTPKKELIKVKSFDIMNSRPTSESIVVGN